MNAVDFFCFMNGEYRLMFSRHRNIPVSPVDLMQSPFLIGDLSWVVYGKACRHNRHKEEKSFTVNQSLNIKVP